MKYIENIHKGGVVSRIAENALVGEPILTNIEGRITELTLNDASTLAYGLLEAIKAVEDHQAQIKKQDHCICIAKTGQGMSVVRQSKLGDSSLNIDIGGVGVTIMPYVSSDPPPRYKSKGESSILDNCSTIKLIMKQ